VTRTRSTPARTMSKKNTKAHRLIWTESAIAFGGYLERSRYFGEATRRSQIGRPRPWIRTIRSARTAAGRVERNARIVTAVMVHSFMTQAANGLTLSRANPHTTE